MREIEPMHHRRLDASCATRTQQAALHGSRFAQRVLALAVTARAEIAGVYGPGGSAASCLAADREMQTSEVSLRTIGRWGPLPHFVLPVHALDVSGAAIQMMGTAILCHSYIIARACSSFPCGDLLLVIFFNWQIQGVLPH